MRQLLLGEVLVKENEAWSKDRICPFCLEDREGKIINRFEQVNDKFFLDKFFPTRKLAYLYDEEYQLCHEDVGCTTCGAWGHRTEYEYTHLELKLRDSWGKPHIMDVKYYDEDESVLAAIFREEPQESPFLNWFKYNEKERQLQVIREPHELFPEGVELRRY